MNSEREEESPIRGDVLEVILSFVPLIHLLSPCRVSSTWRRVVFSSLINLNDIKPWLFVHTQSTYTLESKPTYAYDPRSNIWIEIEKTPTKHVSTLKSFGSDFLYVLTSSRLFVSDDPFNLSWRQVNATSACRDNPIVALCGARIVVAGSCWEFEDDPLAVEVYDSDSSTWRTCQSIPETLKDAADGATWLSVASNHIMMFVTEKATGITYSFNPSVGKWRGPYDLKVEPRVYFSTIGFAGEDLIVVSLIGKPRQVENIRISKVNRETMGCETICDAPIGIVEKLMGSRTILRQIGISPAKDFIYLYNPLEPEELVFCDLAGGDCVWGSTRNVACDVNVRIGGNMVFTCGKVEIEDLDVVMRSGILKFR